MLPFELLTVGCRKNARLSKPTGFGKEVSFNYFSIGEIQLILIAGPR